LKAEVIDLIIHLVFAKLTLFLLLFSNFLPTMRILTISCVFLLAALAKADGTHSNLKGGHKVFRGLQDYPYTPTTLNILQTKVLPSANHVEETTASRKLARRRYITRQPKWISKLQPIPEEEASHMAGATPSRKAKKNVHSTSLYSNNAFGVTDASIPQNMDLLHKKLQEAFQKGLDDARKNIYDEKTKNRIVINPAIRAQQTSTSRSGNVFGATEASIPQNMDLLQKKLQEAFQKGLDDARKNLDAEKTKNRIVINPAIRAQQTSTSRSGNVFGTTEASIPRTPVQRQHTESQHSERQIVNRNSRYPDRLESQALFRFERKDASPGIIVP
jgi:phosphohistidine phosphatase SixA